jgi:hypothetical protein
MHASQRRPAVFNVRDYGATDDANAAGGISPGTALIGPNFPELKAAYHDGRALFNVSERLRRMAVGTE